MILAATTTDRIFVDHAKPGNGLAGVENSNFRAGYLIDKLARDRGDAAHALQEIEDHAFAGEQHARVVANDSYRLIFVSRTPSKISG